MRLRQNKPFVCLLILLTVFSFTTLTTKAQSPEAIRIIKRDPAGHGLLCEYKNKRIIMLEGTSEQMGTAHGHLLKEHVVKMIEECIYLVGTAYSASEGEWFFDHMDDIIRRTKSHTPERFLKECDAMSRTAGLSIRDGRVANFFPELFHCSGVAVRNSASADGRVIHARVLDYMRDVNLQKYAVIQVWMPDSHYAWISLGYAGFIGTVTCMNEEGLAIGEMGGRGEGLWDGMPMSFLLRQVMETAASVPEALDLMQKTPRTCEYYYVLSDHNRNIAGVYATPDVFEVLKPGQQDERLPHVPADTVMFSADERAEKLSERLLRHHGKIDVQTMIEIIKRPVAMKSNLHNAIFRPETLDMWCADAGPDTLACNEPYVRVNLKELIEFYDRAIQAEE